MTTPADYRRILEDKLDYMVDDGHGMTIYVLDGFVFGLLACPGEVPTVSKWFRQVYSRPESPEGYFPFDGIDEMQELLELAICHYNTVAEAIDGPNYLYQPMFCELEGEYINCDEWVEGFARAVDLHPDGWEIYRNGENGDLSQALEHLAELNRIVQGDTVLSEDEQEELNDAAPHLITAYARTLVDPAGIRFAANDEHPRRSGRRIKRRKSESIRETVAKRLVVS